jgi:hypothetical protein
MGGYCAFIVGDDGHITGRVEFFGKDDEEAKRLAKQLVDGTPSSCCRKPA